MKISKNELRKMIFETVLREQEGDVQGTGAGARKTNTPDKEESDTLKSDIEKSVKTIVSQVAGNDSFSGMITIGKKRTEVTRAESKELGQKIERALEDDKDLKVYKESLKSGRAFKITVNKGKNDAPAAEVVDTPEEPESRKAQANQKQYGPINEDDPYIYQVNKETGCWETKKKVGGGNWISLRNNQKATDFLDKNYPGARTDSDKKNCKPSAAKGGSKPAGTPAAAAAGTPSLGSNILHNSKTYKFSNWDGLIAAAGDAYPILKSWINNNENVRKETLLYTNNGKILDIFDFAGNHYVFNKDGFQSTDNDAKSTTDYKNLYNDIIKKGNVLKEVYGKSHGTLIRERYWGRY